MTIDQPSLYALAMTEMSFHLLTGPLSKFVVNTKFCY